VWAAVAVALLVTGCRHGDALAALRRMPEASLRYPGATAVVVTSQTPGPPPEGGRAEAGPVLHVREEARAASEQEVVAFFDGELERRGWHRDAPLPPRIGFVASVVWRRTGRVFVLDVARGPGGLAEITTTLGYGG
jgi:hypothetical protein